MAINNNEKPEYHFGRPYNTRDYSPEEIRTEADSYFKTCDDTIITTYNAVWVIGKNIPKPYTVSWLCVWLWKGKNYITELAKDSTYQGMIAYIYARIEQNLEEWAMMWTLNSGIVSKNLSANFKWTEKTEVKQTVEFADAKKVKVLEELKKRITDKQK